MAIGMHRLMARFPRTGRMLLTATTLVSLALAAGAGQKWVK